MTIIQKKVCMLGSFAVGKTSLVRQYVDSIFSEKYASTIGVKIDKKSLSVSDKEVSLVLWDVYGKDDHQNVLPAYLRGMSGYILVADPTRPSTFEISFKLRDLVETTVGSRPFVLALNKSDLMHQWQMDSSHLAELQSYAVATRGRRGIYDTSC